jgi:hypothetical protein
VNGDFTEVLPYALVAAAMGVAGGLVSAFWRPGPLLRSYIQHLAAGLVAAAVAVELIPQVRELHGTPAPILAGFGAGALLMIAIKWFNQKMEELLVESQEVEEDLTSVGLLFAGFFGIFAIELWAAR